MSAAVTQKRLLDASERAFAESGYAGASIRTIVKMAGTDFGAVRYHFGNKDGLFGAVLKRRLEPLCRERMRLLDGVLANHRSGRPSVEEIVEAFLLPAIRLITHEGHGRAWMKLMGRVRVEPGRYLESVQDVYRELLDKFQRALAQALPELDADELAFRMYFMFGTEVNTMLDDGTLRALGKDLRGVIEDPDGVLRRLVAFTSAGIQAPVRKTVSRTKRAERQSSSPF